MTPPLNLPAPGRCQAIFVILAISHSHVFLVNSRLDHFSAPSPRVPLSRSYGVNLPSSLAVIHSSTSGYSPRPPVSVYGTGPAALGAALAFLAGVLTCSVGLPEGAPYCRASAVAYIPSTRCSVSGRQCRSRVTRGLRRGYRNLDRFHIGCPSRVPLSPRLTLIRLALFRKPWGLRWRAFLSRVVVTHAYIFFSGRSRIPPGTPSTARPECSPTTVISVPVFGAMLDARSSSTRLRSTSELLRTL